MATFARLNGLTSMKLTSTLIVLDCGAITMNSAHAEKYCKSVDQSGNTSYTLAPETGCNKKFKTVSVIQRVTTSVTTPTPTPETSQVSEAQMQEAAKARAEEMAAKAAAKASEQATGAALASDTTEVAKDGQ